MLNSRESYAEAGRKSAQARNQRDEARAQHWADYFRRMRSSEQGDDRITAEQLYREAYTQARTL